MLSEAPPNTALATSSLPAIPACVKTIRIYYNKIRWLIGRFEYFHAYRELFNGEGYLRGNFQLLMKTRCYGSLRKPHEQSKEQHTQLNIQSDFIILVIILLLYKHCELYKYTVFIYMNHYCMACPLNFKLKSSILSVMYSFYCKLNGKYGIYFERNS